MKRFILIIAVSGFISSCSNVMSANLPVDKKSDGYNVSKNYNLDVDHSDLVYTIPSEVSAPKGSIEFISVVSPKVTGPAISKKLYLLHCALRYC